MTPGSFDPATSREVVGDSRARALEAKARGDADNATYDPPEYLSTGSYWAQAQSCFDRTVYHAQYQKRIERNARKAGAVGPS